MLVSTNNPTSLALCIRQWMIGIFILVNLGMRLKPLMLGRKKHRHHTKVIGPVDESLDVRCIVRSSLILNNGADLLVKEVHNINLNFFPEPKIAKNIKQGPTDLKFVTNRHTKRVVKQHIHHII